MPERVKTPAEEFRKEDPRLERFHHREALARMGQCLNAVCLDGGFFDQGIELFTATDDL